MAKVRRRLTHRRTDLRWALLVLGFFAFLLTLTWERIAIKEASGRIERLERELQALRTDEAFLQVRLDQACRFTDVQQIARKEWGMSVADPRQRVLLASAAHEPTGKAVQSAGLFRTASERMTRLIHEGVARDALARPAAGEGARGTRAR